MAEYQSVADAVERNSHYPNLSEDIREHDFQRRRVASCAAFVLPGDTVLEIGCNAGYFADFCPQAREIHGVDVNPELVEIAKTRLTSAQVAQAEALPFPDKSFDVVNVSGVLEQVFDPKAVIREAARVARRLVVGNTTHEAGTWGKHRTERHAWQSYSWSETEMHALLDEFGYATLSTIDVNHPPEPQCWLFMVVLP